jgi:hypothetical protein
LSSYDMQFLSTCRSSRVATVYLTQNTSNVYGALGGEQKGKAMADSIFGNLNTKILHANSDPVTNEWAASLIGQKRQFFMNGGTSREAGDLFALAMGLHQGQHTNSGFSEQLDWEVPPSTWSSFRTGGKGHNWEIDAIVFQNGRTFHDTGRTWRLATFRQRR